MMQVNEGTTAYLSATFSDKTGNADTPSTITYRIDDVRSGTEIRDATTITAASTVEISLSPTDNRILNATQSYETRRVTVVASYGASDQVTAEYTYRVTPLVGVSGNPPVIE